MIAVFYKSMTNSCLVHHRLCFLRLNWSAWLTGQDTQAEGQVSGVNKNESQNKQLALHDNIFRLTANATTCETNALLSIWS